MERLEQTKSVDQLELMVPKLLKDLQDAMVIAHSTGHVHLAEALRVWTEQLIEAVAIDNHAPSELWLG